MYTIRRRPLVIGLSLGLGLLCFALGAWSSQLRVEQQIAENDARIANLRDEMVRSVLETRRARMPRRMGTDGSMTSEAVATDNASRSALVEDIKKQLQSEMGLLPIRILRERRNSFVEVHADDTSGKMSYATAGYLGNGYFITVKHGVIALDRGDRDRKITSVQVIYEGRPVPASVVDSGNANVEVDPGDWAILKVRRDIDLPSLRVDTNYSYDFAEPIFRLGNDYSKGIILSTGYVGQRMESGLVSALTDGHPGVSGGGVLDEKGNLIGIAIGRMDGDYRFSFILPLRPAMFQKVAGLLTVPVS
jgi:hypothetical protein